MQTARRVQAFYGEWLPEVEAGRLPAEQALTNLYVVTLASNVTPKLAELVAQLRRASWPTADGWPAAARLAEPELRAEAERVLAEFAHPDAEAKG